MNRSPREAQRRSRAGDSRGRDLGLAAAFYAVATVALTYPLAFHPASLSRLDNGDAQLNAWAISWVGHQLSTDPWHLFQANIFHPLPNTLAFSEHLFVPGLIALPILRLSDDLVLTFNLVLLIAMFASAMGMYALVSTLTGSRASALLAGLFFSFASYRFARLPHLQMQLYAFMPLALACLHRFYDSGQRRWAIGFGAFFLLQALSGTYLGAMAAVASGIALVTLAVGARRRLSELVFLGLVIVLAVVALYPFVRPYLWVHRRFGVAWDLAGIGSMSATPVSYLASVSRLYHGLVGTLLPETEVVDYLFPGLAVSVLGIVGAVLLAFGRGGFDRPRATLACYTSILVAGFLISLGPGTPFHPFLYEHIVFFKGLRALSRFGLLPLMSLAVLSGHALAWILDRTRAPRLALGAAIFATALFVAESTVVPLTLEPFHDRPPDVYRWLRAEGRPGPIVELPYKRLDTRYMFSARHHGFRPMLNGDSGFIPASHAWVREILLRFPSPDSLSLLRDLDVRYVVIHLGAYGPTNPRLVRLLTDLSGRPRGLEVVKAFGRDLVFELRQEQVPFVSRSARPGDPLPVDGGEVVLLDSNLETRWRGSTVPESLTFRLHGTEQVSGVRFHYGPAPRVPVSRVELEVRGADGQWRSGWMSPPGWTALTEIVLTLLKNPADATQTLAFEPLAAEDVRLRLWGYEAPPEIAEIEILGPGGGTE